MQPDATSADTVRLFLALWPGAAVRFRLAALRDQWQWPADASPVRDERLHLTLHFLGDVPHERVPGLAKALPKDIASFELVLDKVAVWSNDCAVLETGYLPPQLEVLHRTLGQALQGQGLPVQSRPLQPHVTLARHAQGAKPPAYVEPLRWPVRSYVLAQTQRTPPSGFQLLSTY